MTKYYVNNKKVEILKDAVNSIKRNISEKGDRKDFLNNKVNKINAMLEGLEKTPKSHITDYKNYKNINDFIKETYL